MRTKGVFDEFDILLFLPTSCMTCNYDYTIGGECRAGVERAPGKRDFFSCDKFDVHERVAVKIRGESKPLSCDCFMEITAEAYTEDDQEIGATFEIVVPLQKGMLKRMAKFLENVKEIEESE